MKGASEQTGISISKWGCSLVVLVVMTACSPFHAEDPLLDGSNSSGALGGDPVAQEKAMAYLQSNCLGCHGANGSGGVSNITDINHLIASGLIVPGNPTAGRLIGSMEDGSMPTAQRASTADLQIIRDWLGSDWQAGGNGSDGSGDPGGGGTTPPTPALVATYDSIRANILVPKCIACHGPNKADDNVRYDTYAFTLGAGGYKNSLNLVDPTASSFYRECNSGKMPPQNKGYQPLTPTELQVVYDWMLSGAPEK
ncbi:MAG: hypothetical protein H6624_08915 [Bdellovibrionaceae bacterium]|nr:hypothetical protein [Bdellovibrionales bacterium]MCB9084454.1 hypothetical protein [Pseudobdellovibrionaceae bacterium]